MRRKFTATFILSAALCSLAVHPANAAEVASQPHTARMFSDGNGKQRYLIPLSGYEISTALLGQRFVVDREMDWYPNKISIGFSEDFLPNGSWTIGKAVRAVIVEKGMWRIVDHQICTRVTHSPFGIAWRKEVCRGVWRDRASAKIAMIGTLGMQPDVLIFSSSPLK